MPTAALCATVPARALAYSNRSPAPRTRTPTMAKSIGPQFTPSVPLPGSGTPSLNAMARAGTASTAAVMSTQRYGPGLR